MRKALVLLAMLAVLLAQAFASLEGPSSFASDCFSDPIIAEYKLKNELSETVKYTINIEGAETNFDVQIRPQEITLGPNEETTVYLFIKPCCWAKPGSYALTLKATSAKQSYEKSINFKVLESRKIELSVSPSELVLGQCEESEAIVKVENKSPVRETIVLSIEGSAAELLMLSETELTLDSGASKEVSVKAKAPCETQKKELSATIKATIKDTEITSERELKVRLIDKQIIVLEKKSFEACNDVSETKTLKIKNIGRASDELELSIEAPEWILSLIHI